MNFIGLNTAYIRHMNRLLLIIVFAGCLNNAIKVQGFSIVHMRYFLESVEKELVFTEIKRTSRTPNEESQLRSLNSIQAIRIRVLFLAVTLLTIVIIGLHFNSYRLKKKSNGLIENLSNHISLRQVELDLLSNEKEKLFVENEILIKEIKHIIKNNLELIISLINTQVAYLSANKYFEALQYCQQRKQVITLIYKHLCPTEGWATINLSGYLHDLTTNLWMVINKDNHVRIGLKCDKIDLDVFAAVSLGLIINEAVINATSHSFPDNKGRLVIIHSFLNKYCGLQLEINGNGIVASNTCLLHHQSALGINLMRDLSKELKGRLLFSNENGVKITLLLPAKEHVITLSPYQSNGDISSLVVI
ncbi:MAG: sensor histidine kinase [Mucilaginibacter sp.]|jgi:two-component sensor histidine kinase|uniref:sensor histidine kinase n=1 Tax=Mucilaginibacter sp. TaxID=1882438 RepID=UPI00356AFDFB